MLSRVAEQYLLRTPHSAALDRRAERVMPGGDTRSVIYHPPYPLALVRAQADFVWDVDGNRYIDLLGNYTSLVHGHAYPPIVEAITRTVRAGSAWAARSPAQVRLAEVLCERVASVERVRFCNSGTEAGMLAAQVARHLTGRELLLMARRGYHGSYEDLESSSPGRRTLFAEFGSAESFERLLDERGGEIAAVFLEPVLGSGGVVAPPPDFLQRVRQAARRAGALFVLDEVITLRLAPGGAQELFGVRPDLTMMGKIIGGGLPAGALGGSAEVMACLDPHSAGSLYHSGTFNGNPATCAAGAVSVTELTAARIAYMETQAGQLAAELERAARQLELRASVRQVGSLLNVVFSAESADEGSRMQRDFHLAALNHGVFMAPRGLIALSTVVSEQLISEICERLASALRDAAAA